MLTNSLSASFVMSAPLDSIYQTLAVLEPGLSDDSDLQVAVHGFVASCESGHFAPLQDYRRLIAGILNQRQPFFASRKDVVEQAAFVLASKTPHPLYTHAHATSPLGHRYHPAVRTQEVEQNSEITARASSLYHHADGSIRWDVLDEIADRILNAQEEAFDKVETVTQAGLLAEMRLAIEHRSNPNTFSASNREKALSVLRRIEKDWEQRFLTGESDPTGRIRLETVHYLRALDLDSASLSEISFKQIDCLVLLHFYLSETLRDVEPRGSPSQSPSLGDFLLGEKGLKPSGKGCLPLALLAIHLGRRVGLPLKAYPTSNHMSVFAEIGTGFLYEPAYYSRIFNPPDFYSYLLLAPEGRILLEDAAFVFGNLDLEDKNRLVKFYRIFVRKFPHVEQGWVGLFKLADDFTQTDAKEFVRWFPNAPFVRLIFANVLLNGRQRERALEEMQRGMRLLSLHQERASRVSEQLVLRIEKPLDRFPLRFVKIVWRLFQFLVK